MSRSQGPDTLARSASPQPPARLLDEGSPVAMWIFDARTLSIVWTNRAMRSRYAWSDDEAARKALGDLCAPNEPLEIYASFAADGAEGRSIEARHRRADGEVLDLTCTVTPYEEDGRRLALVHEIDVTMRRRNERETEASLRRLRALIDHSSDGIAINTVDSVVTYVSPAVERILGFKPEDLVRKNGSPLAHPEDLERVRDAYQKLMRTPGARETFLSRITAADGQMRWIESAATNLTHDAAVAGIVFHFRDVTDRVAAIEGQRVASARLASLLRCTSVMIYSCAVEPPFAATFVSDNVRSGLGYDPAQVLSEPSFWVERLHPDERERILSDVGRVFAEGRHVFEYRLRHADGTYRWIHDDVALVRRDDGTPQEMVGCFYDVTARKEAEQALRRSETNYRVLIEHLPTALFIHWDDRILYVNPALLALLGYDRAEELIGRSPFDILPPQMADVVRERIGRFAHDPTHLANPPREGEWLRRDGKIVSVESESLRVDFDGSTAIAVFGRDLTERREILSRLAVADRMASLGTLAAGVAHEINNPLAYVSTNLALLADDLPALLKSPDHARLSVSAVQALLSDARLGAARVRDVVRDLRSLARVDEQALEPVDVREVLESCVRIAANEIHHRARIAQRLDDVPLVLANASRLGQVFLNLLVNAAQSIPDGHAASNEIRIATFAAPTGEAVIEVTDTGCGIPPDLAARVFDPFFTTKPLGTGTGLGLSICHRIVTSLGGQIFMRSAPDRGTTFRVVLPASTLTEKVAPNQSDVPQAARRGRVLLIDDEPKIATTLRVLFEGEHEIVAVTRARDALAMLERGEVFDIALCDLMMPEINGAEFYASVARAMPSFAPRIVFMTGGAFTPSTREFLENVDNPRIEKPFDTTVLRAILASALQSAGAP